MKTIQKIFRFFLSKKSFEKAKTESQSWYFSCDCGHEFSIWDIGGIRYKAKGNPTIFTQCPHCKGKAARKIMKR